MDVNHPQCDSVYYCVSGLCHKASKSVGSPNWVPHMSNWLNYSTHAVFIHFLQRILTPWREGWAMFFTVIQISYGAQSLQHLAIRPQVVMQGIGCVRY